MPVVVETPATTVVVGSSNACRHYGEPGIADPGTVTVAPGQVKFGVTVIERDGTVCVAVALRLSAQFSGVTVTVLDDEIVVVLDTSRVEENEAEES